MEPRQGKGELENNPEYRQNTGRKNMARKTKNEAQETRKTILYAAMQVLLTRGIARTQLADIAREAGVTRGAIYWHFGHE